MTASEKKGSNPTHCTPNKEPNRSIVASIRIYLCKTVPPKGTLFQCHHHKQVEKRKLQQHQESMTDDKTSTTTTTTTIRIRDMDCVVHKWNVDDDSSTERIKGIVVVYHGFLAHGKYPTVKYVAELLGSKENGYGVLAVDLPGHGLSPGLRGYIPNSQILIDDGITIAKSARKIIKDSITNGDTSYVDTLKLFLVGSSMGGAIALSVAQQMSTSTKQKGGEAGGGGGDESIDGVILLAPMLQLNVSDIEHTLLTGLSWILPTLAVIPSSATSDEKQYRDITKREECSNDTLTISGSKLRIGSALSCVDITKYIQSQFTQIRVPYLLQIATEDVVVKNDGSYKLYQETPITTDKTMKEYPALHGLLCEPKPLLDTIQNDIVSWIQQRT